MSDGGATDCGEEKHRSNVLSLAVIAEASVAGKDMEPGVDGDGDEEEEEKKSALKSAGWTLMDWRLQAPLDNPNEVRQQHRVNHKTH